MSAAYNDGGNIQKGIRRVLALPPLPALHISAVFIDQKQKADTNERLECSSTWKINGLTALSGSQKTGLSTVNQVGQTMTQKVYVKKTLILKSYWSLSEIRMLTINTYDNI